MVSVKIDEMNAVEMMKIKLTEIVHQFSVAYKNYKLETFSGRHYFIRLCHYIRISLAIVRWAAFS